MAKKHARWSNEELWLLKEHIKNASNAMEGCRLFAEKYGRTLVATYGKYMDLKRKGQIDSANKQKDNNPRNITTSFSSLFEVITKMLHAENLEFIHIVKDGYEVKINKKVS